MRTLVFDFNAIEPLLQHAELAPAHRATYRHLAEPEFWLPGAVPNDLGVVTAEDVDPAKIEPSLLLVKDQGAYLMSAGIPGLKKPNEKSNQVVYAKGCDPHKDEHWWDTAATICGGDDFAVDIPLEAFPDPADRAVAVLIDMDDDDIAIRWELLPMPRAIHKKGTSHERV